MSNTQKTVEIELINPWNGATVCRDVTEITDEQIQGYALDPEIADLVHNDAGWETPGEWLAAYVGRAGAAQAGREIIGS